MKELYGINIPFPLRMGSRLVFFSVRVPGWINFSVLRARATSLPFTRANRAQRRRHGVA